MSPRWEPIQHIPRGRSTVWNLRIHLVFVTKYRRGALTRPILSRCRDICRDAKAELIEFNGDEDPFSPCCKQAAPRASAPPSIASRLRRFAVAALSRTASSAPKTSSRSPATPTHWPWPTHSSSASKTVPLSGIIEPQVLIDAARNTIVYEQETGLRDHLFKLFATSLRPSRRHPR
jgi:hypothetical protein